MPYSPLMFHTIHCRIIWYTGCMRLVKRIERWRDIPGWEELYQASTFGQIRNARTGRILQPWPTRGGYVKVNLYRDGKRDAKSVHLLVALTFLGPCPPGQQVRHYKTNDRTQNALWNLRYGTPDDQIDDRKRHGTFPGRPSTGWYTRSAAPEFCRAGKHPYVKGGCEECKLEQRKPRKPVTHCPSNHEYNEDNAFRNAAGSWVCRICIWERAGLTYDPRKTCKRGHLKIRANRYVHPNGATECIPCRQILDRERRARLSSPLVSA